MKKIVASACMVSLLVPGPATLQAGSDIVSQPVPTARSGGTYCRSPEPLPDLGREVENQQQAHPHRPRPATAVRTAPAMAEEASDHDSGPHPAPPPPPPPPPPRAGVADEAEDRIVVTGSRVDRKSMDSPAPEASVESAETADRSRYMPVPPPYPPRPPRPQSGLLTAGEHDDLLNPELYADYVRKSDLGQRLRDLPLLDTSSILRVRAIDSRGQAVPFMPIELRCEDGNSITLNSVADGSAVFFPGLDRLSENVWVRAGDSKWRLVRLADAEGAQSVTIRTSDYASKVRKLDLALVVDVTGSMSDELRFLQAELRTIIDSLEARHRDIDIRVAFSFYRDQGDEFVTRTFDFDSDVPRAQTRLAAQYATGGGDYEEAMQDALVRAANLEWRDDAVKSLLLVGDAPPHDEDIPQTWLAAEHLRAERVHVVPVGASGVADVAEYVMRAMAAATQSRYTFLTDDSGIGNPHAKPAIDCYLVTRLDQLLRRVIDSQISGRRIEPEKNEVIRAVGQYDAGKCILPPDFAEQVRKQKDA
ncbi:vWA domain-containing protein [Qipengyuania vesicularis]|uniref:vWA domain-containing protein n=1 Tax=Qipengyuania vesicularis TaxID=2867232 RepID=UPI001C86E608|nr:vWA domain-containing protein [Qipengyuania vesicularis]MBX7527220.1 VWA domain-containing protein [Qipengyuania vesicularis]